ncbi:MAG: vitamin B12 dependent methionine synthase, partial [Deltaproteobacteria bacterium]|nr:vitamin B12 dependent methionine synthase [Deltaproteobacteria bacterium]
MDSFVLDNTPFQIDTGQLYKSLRIKEGSELVARLKPLIDKAQAMGKPKAAYKVAFIESRGDDQVIIDG